MGEIVGFVVAAEVLSGEARRQGLVVPGFRSPPRRPGQTRALVRHVGGATVVVATHGRAPADVVGDMIDGVIAANRLDAENADRLRVEMWEVVSKAGLFRDVAA